ncbi:MAG: PilZ domain-containing protein [Acidobacteriota bacterium]|nr:PilZ domain-containing protein [Acidobacteriota bacterium]
MKPSAETELLPQSGFTEMRGAVRFPLHLAVVVCQGERSSQAVTRDISAGGVLLHCDEEYAVGSTIRFSIALPAHTMGAPKDVHVVCTGRVVRCTPAGAKMAVGAIIDEYKINR